MNPSRFIPVRNRMKLVAPVTILDEAHCILNRAKNVVLVDEKHIMCPSVRWFGTLHFGPRKRRYESRMTQKGGPVATFGSRFGIDLDQE